MLGGPVVLIAIPCAFMPRRKAALLLRSTPDRRTANRTLPFALPSQLSEKFDPFVPIGVNNYSTFKSWHFDLQSSSHGRSFSSARSICFGTLSEPHYFAQPPLQQLTSWLKRVPCFMLDWADGHIHLFAPLRAHPCPSDRHRMAEIKRCHDHATAGRAGSGGDCTTSGASQGVAAFQLGEGGCTQPTE